MNERSSWRLSWTFSAQGLGSRIDEHSLRLFSRWYDEMELPREAANQSIEAIQTRCARRHNRVRSRAQDFGVLVLNCLHQVFQQQPNRLDRRHAAGAADIRVVAAQIRNGPAALAGEHAIMVRQVDEALLVIHEPLDGFGGLDRLNHEDGIYRKIERGRIDSPQSAKTTGCL